MTIDLNATELLASAERNPRGWARWAAAMAIEYPDCATHYREAEREYISEAEAAEAKASEKAERRRIATMFQQDREAALRYVRGR